MNPIEQGIKYKAINPTFNTAAKWNADNAQSFAETAASLALVNGSNTIALHLNYIRLIVSGAGTNGTNLLAVAQVDTTNRYSSGGTALTSIATNAGSYTPQGTAYFGALVTIAPSANALKLTGGQVQLNSSNPAANEQYIFCGNQSFQLNDIPAPKAVLTFDSVIVPPGGTFLLHLFSASQTAAPTAFIDMEWTER